MKLSLLPASERTPGNARLAVIILTRNEEVNLPHALDSVCGWADEVLVIDSFSTDRTMEIAQSRGCLVVQHPFEDYGRQRNAALAVSSDTEWVLFLDADEWITPELKAEISCVIRSQASLVGYFVKFRLIWMGRWIRRGYYPTWILRLFRRGTSSCEAREVNEHLRCSGPTGYLKHDLMHEDRKPLSEWIDKHNRYATWEALELLRQRNKESSTQIEARLFGTQAQRKRWLRQRVWNRLPLLVRPFLYFLYRYLFRGGFLDGRAGFSYHFLQGWWFQVLVDLKYLEMKRNQTE